MLRFYPTHPNILGLTLSDLNTSHVKVLQKWINVMEKWKGDLNTSHVKVLRY